MHGGEVLGGPIWFFAVAVMLIATGLAIYVTVESLRPRWREAARRLPEPMWIYTAGQGFFLFTLLLVQLAPLPPIAGAFLVALVPFSMAQAIAFLLRVVFPRDAGPAGSHEQPSGSEARTEQDRRSTRSRD